MKPLCDCKAAIRYHNNIERLQAEVEQKDRLLGAAWDCLSNVVATCAAGGTAAELADIAADFIAPNAPITEADLEWARQQILCLSTGGMTVSENEAGPRTRWFLGHHEFDDSSPHWVMNDGPRKEGYVYHLFVPASHLEAEKGALLSLLREIRKAYPDAIGPELYQELCSATEGKPFRDAEVKRLREALQGLVNAENSITTFESDEPDFSLISVADCNLVDQAVERAEQALSTKNSHPFWPNSEGRKGCGICGFTAEEHDPLQKDSQS